MFSVKNTLLASTATLLLSSLAFYSCKKDKKQQATTPSQTAIILYNNVKIIDSSKAALTSTNEQLGQGIYVFTGTSLPNISSGDIIAGIQGEGFLRKVISIDKGSNTITLQTQQAALGDAVKSGTYQFDNTIDNLTEEKTTAGVNADLSNITLYQNGPLTIKTTSGNIALNTDFHFNWEFNNDMVYFEMLSQKNTLNGNVNINVTASQNANLIDKTDTLKKYTSRKLILIGEMPVYVRTDIYIVAKISANINAVVNRDINVSTNNTFDLGFKYTNGAWETTYNMTPSGSINTTQSTGGAGATLNVSIYPQINIKFDGIVGPYASIALKEFAIGNVASPALDWDLNLGAYLQPTLGIEASIFSHSIANFSKSWTTDTFSYKTPYRILKVSGDNQTGTAGQALAQPLKVQVVDNVGNAQSNVPVYFSVTAGGGSISPASVMTDANGYASAQWSLGSQTGFQYINVQAKKADGAVLNGAPIVFAATGQNDQVNMLLTNGSSKTWHVNYYTNNGLSASTACMLDDAFTFNTNGSISINRNGTYLLGNDSCGTTSQSVISGTWSYQLVSGAEPGYIITFTFQSAQYSFFCDQADLTTSTCELDGTDIPYNGNIFGYFTLGY